MSSTPAQDISEASVAPPETPARLPVPVEYVARFTQSLQSLRRLAMLPDDEFLPAAKAVRAPMIILREEILNMAEYTNMASDIAKLLASLSGVSREGAALRPRLHAALGRYAARREPPPMISVPPSTIHTLPTSGGNLAPPQMMTASRHVSPVSVHPQSPPRSPHHTTASPANSPGRRALAPAAPAMSEGRSSRSPVTYPHSSSPERRNSTRPPHVPKAATSRYPKEGPSLPPVLMTFDPNEPFNPNFTYADGRTSKMAGFVPGKYYPRPGGDTHADRSELTSAPAPVTVAKQVGKANRASNYGPRSKQAVIAGGSKEITPKAVAGSSKRRVQKAPKKRRSGLDAVYLAEVEKLQKGKGKAKSSAVPEDEEGEDGESEQDDDREVEEEDCDEQELEGEAVGSKDAELPSSDDEETGAEHVKQLLKVKQEHNEAHEASLHDDAMQVDTDGGSAKPALRRSTRARRKSTKSAAIVANESDMEPMRPPAIIKIMDDEDHDYDTDNDNASESDVRALSRAPTPRGEDVPAWNRKRPRNKVNKPGCQACKELAMPCFECFDEKLNACSYCAIKKGPCSIVDGKRKAKKAKKEELARTGKRVAKRLRDAAKKISAPAATSGRKRRASNATILGDEGRFAGPDEFQSLVQRVTKLEKSLADGRKELEAERKELRAEQERFRRDVAGSLDAMKAFTIQSRLALQEERVKRSLEDEQRTASPTGGSWYLGAPPDSSYIPVTPSIIDRARLAASLSRHTPSAPLNTPVLLDDHLATLSRSPAPSVGASSKTGITAMIEESQGSADASPLPARTFEVSPSVRPTAPDSPTPTPQIKIIPASSPPSVEASNPSMEGGHPLRNPPAVSDVVSGAAGADEEMNIVDHSVPLPPGAPTIPSQDSNSPPDLQVTPNINEVHATQNVNDVSVAGQDTSILPAAVSPSDLPIPAAQRTLPHMPVIPPECAEEHGVSSTVANNQPMPIPCLRTNAPSPIDSPTHIAAAELAKRSLSPIQEELQPGSETTEPQHSAGDPSPNEMISHDSLEPPAGRTLQDTRAASPRPPKRKASSTASVRASKRIREMSSSSAGGHVQSS